MKIYSTQQILNTCPKVNKSNKSFSKWYSHLQKAKKQLGNKLEKIEITMAYIKFENISEEDDCFNYLMENL